MNKALSAILGIMMSACTASATLDTLTTKTETHKGMFMGLKNEKFVFQLADGKELKLMKASVTAITLDPPGKFTIKPRGKKDMTDMKLISFEHPNFTYEDAKGTEQKISIVNVSSVTPGMDFSRPALDTSAAKAGPEAGKDGKAEPAGKDDPEADPIESQLKKDVVNVVYFVKAGDMASDRQGSFLESVVRDSKGKVNAIKMPITAGNDAISAKYSITSYPQFWVYDKKGKIFKKLVERFTENDIEGTIKEAKKKM